VLQCVAVCCSVSSRNNDTLLHAVFRHLPLHIHARVAVRCLDENEKRTTTHCNTLKHTAIPDVSHQSLCSTLGAILHSTSPHRHAATHQKTRQHTATHGNTQQHTAAHRNTPQFSTTRCNTWCAVFVAVLDSRRDNNLPLPWISSCLTSDVCACVWCVWVCVFMCVCVRKRDRACAYAHKHNTLKVSLAKEPWKL